MVASKLAPAGTPSGEAGPTGSDGDKVTVDAAGTDATTEASDTKSNPPGEEGKHVKFEHVPMPADAMLARSDRFLRLMNLRRSVRFFDSKKLIPDGVLERCIMTAGTAPSGAHIQPWTFVVVKSQAKKDAIRALIEAKEAENYAGRMQAQWVGHVRGLVDAMHGTAAGEAVRKPYLSEAPALVCVMMHRSTPSSPVYYGMESVGIATGMLISALQNVGLCTLTSTPLGADAEIRKVLGRPEKEKVFVVMPVGFASEGCTVPYRSEKELRKSQKKVMVEA